MQKVNVYISNNVNKYKAITDVEKTLLICSQLLRNAAATGFLFCFVAFMNFNFWYRYEEYIAGLF